MECRETKGTRVKSDWKDRREIWDQKENEVYLDQWE